MLPVIIAVEPERRSKGLDKLQRWHVNYQFCGVTAEITVYAKDAVEAHAKAVDQLRARSEGSLNSSLIVLLPAALDRPRDGRLLHRPRRQRAGARPVGASRAPLIQKLFVVDPIAGVRYSRATSIVSSAYKRHGRILGALRESLRDSNRHSVWSDLLFRVSREADALANTPGPGRVSAINAALRQSSPDLADRHGRV